MPFSVKCLVVSSTLGIPQCQSVQILSLRTSIPLEKNALIFCLMEYIPGCCLGNNAGREQTGDSDQSAFKLSSNPLVSALCLTPIPCPKFSENKPLACCVWACGQVNMGGEGELKVRLSIDINLIAYFQFSAYVQSQTSLRLELPLLLSQLQFLNHLYIFTKFLKIYVIFYHSFVNDG